MLFTLTHFKLWKYCACHECVYVCTHVHVHVSVHVCIHSQHAYIQYVHTHTHNFQIEVMLHYTARASGMYVAMYQCSYVPVPHYDTVYVSGNVYKCMTVSNCARIYMNMCN